MTFRNETFQVRFVPAEAAVYFEGSIRLPDPAVYEQLLRFLREAYTHDIPELILDFTDLQFLNSAGLEVLYRFFFSVRDWGTTLVRIVGNRDTAWQTDSLPRFQSLWDSIRLSYRSAGSPRSSDGPHEPRDV